MARASARGRTRAAKAAEPPIASAIDEPVAFDDDGIKRVQDIIRNARATWFALLGALVFAAITLASVKDVSFFVNTVETKLPLVGISVPVVSFFWAGSLLIAALYAYFHLYLELLWQALGDAPARVKERPLADRIEPWIVSDTALRLRDRLRGAEGDARAGRKRPMHLAADIVSLGLVWFFGLAVIGWFWWRSMPKHEPLFTLFLGVVFVAALWVFLSSLWSAWSNLADRVARWRWEPWFLAAMLGIFCVTLVRTGKPTGREFVTQILYPAPADLREIVFTEKPRDWQGKEIAEAEFRIRWCRERGEPKCANPLAIENRVFLEAEEKAFQGAWKERWRALLHTFPKPDLRNADLRGADLALSELEGINLENANLEGANIESVRLDAANLKDANLNNADLFSSSVEGAILGGARLRNAQLSATKLDDSDLSSADLRDANLVGAQLNFAFLFHANLKEADLRGAQLKGANLAGANLTDADLGSANFEDAFLGQANLQNSRFAFVNFKAAYLVGAQLGERNLEGAIFEDANLAESNFDGAKLAGVNLKNSDLRGSTFKNANLRETNLEGAELSDSDFSRAILFKANLANAKLGKAKLEATDLRYANMTGANLEAAVLNEVNLALSRLENAIFEGAMISGSAEKKLTFKARTLDTTKLRLAALRRADLSNFDQLMSTHLVTVFGDASVSIPATIPWPCHWGRRDEGPLGDAQFFGRWKGWLEFIEERGSTPIYNIAPQLEEYEAIHPPAECSEQPFEKK
jgi:uncharacterized protein YjbI with pentapeptide repeats